MGAWNTNILGNDTSAEVVEYFKRMYNYQEGGDFKWSPEQITDSICTYYQDTMQDLPSEKCNVLFALAQALWQKGELKEELKTTVKKLVQEKVDHNAWKDLDADEKTLKSRWQATTKFCEMLDTAYDKANKRVLQPKKVSLYTSGDCLAFKHKGFYYGIAVVNDGRNLDDGSNELAFVNIKSKTVPVLQDFKQSNFILNEDLINYFSGNTNTVVPSNAVYVIKMGKAPVKSLQKAAVFIGTLPLTRTFFESSSIRYNSYPAAHRSSDLMVKDAVSFWLQQPWKAAAYKLQYECAVPYNKAFLKNEELQFGELKCKLKDIEVSIYNSLWHINVTFRIKGKESSAIEKYWTHFVAVFENLTGREVNLLTYAHTTTEGLLPFTQTDFTKFKMKHVSDTAII